MPFQGNKLEQFKCSQIMQTKASHMLRLWYHDRVDGCRGSQDSPFFKHQHVKKLSLNRGASKKSVRKIVKAVNVKNTADPHKERCNKT